MRLLGSGGGRSLRGGDGGSLRGVLEGFMGWGVGVVGFWISWTVSVSLSRNLGTLGKAIAG